MSKTSALTHSRHQDIYNQIKSSFSDFHMFDYLVADKLKQAIVDADSIELNFKTTKKVAERYFDVESFKTAEQKLVWAQIQLIFKSCYVLILSQQESSRAMFWEDTETLLEHYPQFSTVDADELALLLNFRNMVKVTLLLVPARLNKQCILKIAGRLEGSQNEYITGGGQKPAVTRRVEIYEQEGGITAEKRPDRNRSAKTDRTETGKRSATTFSEKKVKLIRLQSDEMRFLTKGPANPFPNLLPSVGAATAPKTHTTHTAPAKVHKESAADEFMSPLSALSAAASRMLNVPEHKPSTLPVVAGLDFPPILSRGGSAGLPELLRECSDPLSGYLMGSDVDFWKESINTAELRAELKGGDAPSLLQRGSSLTFDFGESLGTAFPEPVGGEGKAGGPLGLQRGFSLGFYSSALSEDLRSLVPQSPAK